MEFVVTDNTIDLKSGRLELYTPQHYIDNSSNAIRIAGDTVSTLGLLPYKFYAKETDKKPTKVGIFNNPSVVTFYPVNISQNVFDGIWDGIYDYSNRNEYAVMTFTAGRKIMNKHIVKNLNNVVLFTDYLLAGKLDNNIPYNMLSAAWVKNMVTNNVNLEVPGSVIGLIIRQLCRDVKNRDRVFADVIGKDPKVSPVAYAFANIRTICAATSVFTALAFEDMNSMLDSSLNMTSKEKEQIISPVEQVLKM